MPLKFTKIKGELDGFLVDAGLLLNYHKASVAAYHAVGIESGFVRREPFFSWLPQALESDLEDASAIQAAYDQNLATILFDFKTRVFEQPALDLAHLFIESGNPVHVVSHESPDALDAIIGRAGLPSSVERHALVPASRRDEVVTEVMNNSKWLAVYDWGLSRAQERSIIDALVGRGVLVNVKEPTNRSADEELLRAIEERWLK